MAYVVLKPGAAVSEDELIAHARRNLAAYKVPLRIVPITRLPQSAIGKIARSRLRRAAIALISEESHEPTR